MDYPKLPIRAVAPRFPFLRASSYPNHKFHRSSVFVLFASAMALVAAFYLLIASRSSSSQRFGVVIDAGSSGTRIHVFSVESNRGTMPLLDLGSTAVMRVTPGLSSYTGDPDRAGESLVDLLKFARGKVGKEQWADVEVRLMATAGLRMVGIAAREKILESCRRVLRASGFRFQDDWATVIPGSHEGMYAWVAANYALGTLGGVPEKTTGIIELGGASAQVTFVSNEALPPEFSHALKIGEMMYYVYSNSFLHFGQNVAHKSLLELLSSKDIKTSKEVMTDGVFLDPCSPKGYHQVAQSTFSPSTNNSNLENLSHAVGNFSACRSAAALLLDKEKGDCLHQQCYLGSTFIPKMQGNFVATENFFFTSKFFGLDPTSSLSDLMVANTKIHKSIQSLAFTSLSLSLSLSAVTTILGTCNQSMEKLLMMSILTSTPAEVSGGSWMEFLGLKKFVEVAAARSNGSGGGRGQGEGRPEAESKKPQQRWRPSFAPEFDGLNCFETLVSH